MRRRDFLGSLGILATAGIGTTAGCLSTETTTTSRSPPLVENRPEAVYVPSHIEGMEMVGMGEAGDYSVGLMFSFPHRFWTVTGSRPEKVTIKSDDTVHLMASVWDSQTGMVLPVASGLSTRITRRGEEIEQKPPWPMVSQNMGFHYGDNYKLEGDGTYEVEVELGSMNVRKMGEFEGRFGEKASTTIEFDYSQAERERIRYSLLDNSGETDAVDLMEMEMVPSSVAPAEDELPGSVQETKSSGDADFVVTVLDEGRFAGENTDYVAVSPRTPYNSVVLPMMSLSATVERGGETVFDGDLTTAMDHELGYHYGANAEVESGDRLVVNVDTPPQVSRHEGYETAFLDMPPVEFEIEV